MKSKVHSKKFRPCSKADQPIADILLDALPCGVLVIDAYERVAAVNQQAALILGWSAPALEGQSAHEILQCEAEDNGNECPLRAVLRGKSPSCDGRMRVRCRDAGFKNIEYRCVAYPPGTQLGAILAFRDLSSQIELEKDLHRLASIAEESPIPIVELNEDANLIHANPAMMSLIERFGFSSDARPAILPVEIVKLTAECLQIQTEIDGVEVSLGGSHYEWKLVPVIRENLVRAYGIDLTLCKRAELELKQAQTKSELTSRAKSEFLANMSHELRSPINVILGLADLLVGSGLNDQQREYVKNIHSCAESFKNLIDDVIDMAALEAGKIELRPSSFELRRFIDQIVSGFAPRFDQKRLSLRVKISDKVPARIRCDRKRLRQVLHNLITNALRFTEQGGIAIEVDKGSIATSSPRSHDKGDGTYIRTEAFFLFFTVRDTGVGISPEKQHMVFDRFSRLDSSSTRRYGGVGLGLAISKQLIELMGGKIGVESETGRGSQFWFSLPVQSGDATDPPVDD